jgi:hypothetical protein
MRLFDHAMEHLWFKAEDWYQAAPLDSTEERAADTLCVLLNRYYEHVAARYARKREEAWTTILASF